jgi:hypothetical protein
MIKKANGFELWISTELKRLDRINKNLVAAPTIECGIAIGARSQMLSVLEMYRRFKAGGDQWKFKGAVSEKNKK